MLTYSQSTGELKRSDGTVLGICYSGTQFGRNNPSMEKIQSVGPIPKGKYTIGPAYNDKNLGPLVMHVDPLMSTNTYGRSTFRVHGDNKEHDASHGCIVAPRQVRQELAISSDRELEVIE